MWLSDQNNRMMYNSKFIKKIELDGFDIVVYEDKEQSLLATYDDANVSLQVYEWLQESLKKEPDNFVFQLPAEEEVFNE